MAQTFQLSKSEYSSDFKHSNMTVVAGNNTYRPEENDQLVPLT